MPISELQARILKQISANWSPERHLAGATVLNRADESPRFSQDLDQSKTPVCPDPSSDQFPALIRHRGSVGGAWPVIQDSN